MSKEAINLFISHCGEDEKFIEPFKELVGSKYNVRDSSIVETEPNNAQNSDYIKYSILAPKINWSGTMIVLIGPDMRDSDYVNWEIEYAMKHNKQIIGVYLPGANRYDVPEALEKYGDALVGWDSVKIASAIGGNPRWEKSNGDLRSYLSGFRGAC